MFVGFCSAPSPDHSSQETLGLVSTWMGDCQKWPSRKTEFSFFVALHKAGRMPLQWILQTSFLFVHFNNSQKAGPVGASITHTQHNPHKKWSFHLSVWPFFLPIISISRVTIPFFSFIQLPSFNFSILPLLSAFVHANLFFVGLFPLGLQIGSSLVVAKSDWIESSFPKREMS